MRISRYLNYLKKSGSPYWYFRKYLFILKNFPEFVRRRKYASSLKDSVPAGCASSLKKNCYTMFEGNFNDKFELITYCRALQQSNSTGEVLDGGKSVFLRTLMDTGDVHKHPKILKFVSDDFFKNVASAYIGEEAVLTEVKVIESFPSHQEATHSQLWHLDGDDTSMVAYFLYCSDVDSESGPFVLAERSRMGRMLAPRFFRRYGFNDAQFRNYCPDDGIKNIVGPMGTLFATDPTNVYHFGSRCKKRPRLVLTFRYQSFSGLYPLRFSPEFWSLSAAA
jgi:hypothetical protein